MLIPGTKVQASFYTFSKAVPPLYYSVREGSLTLASVNAGNSDGLCVGGGGVNKGFLIDLTANAGQKNVNLNGCVSAGTKDDYQFRHLQLIAKAGKSGTASETYSTSDPCAFSYVNSTQVSSKATSWYEGVCFVDVFDAGLCPAGNTKNAAMLYVAPPKGDHYASDADFLAAITATAANIIRTIAGYNAIAAQQGLPVIEALRNTLYSSVLYNPHDVDHGDIARAIFAGFESELLANANTGLVELQFPVGGSADPLFAAVQTDLSSSLNQQAQQVNPPPQQVNLPPQHAPGHVPFDAAVDVPPQAGGAVVVAAGGEGSRVMGGEGEGEGKGPEPGSDPECRVDSVSAEEAKELVKSWQYNLEAADTVAKSRIAATDIVLQVMKTGLPVPASADVVVAPRDPQFQKAMIDNQYGVLSAVNQDYAQPGDPLATGDSNAQLPAAVPVSSEVVADIPPPNNPGPGPGVPPPNEASNTKTYAIIGGITFLVLAIVGAVATVIWAAVGGPLRPKPKVSPTADPDALAPSAEDQPVAVSATVTSAAGLYLQEGGAVTFTLTDASNPPVTIGTTGSVSVTSGGQSSITATGEITIPANTKAGSYTLTAEYVGGYDDATGTTTLAIATAAIATTTTITSVAAVTAGASLPVAATVTASDGSTLPAGSTVTFTLTDASTPPQVVGTLSGVSLMSGATPANETIAILSSAAAGAYTLTASYSGAPGYAPGSASHTITVSASANPAPVITTNPSSATVIAGGTVIFTAAATPAAAPVQWDVSTDGGSTFTALANAMNSTLTITGVTAAMSSNQYRAVFGSGTATAPTSAATLTVSRVVFLGTDAVTQGKWSGVYGQAGYAIPQSLTGSGGPVQSTIVVPANVTLTPPTLGFQYVAGVSDPRAVQTVATAAVTYTVDLSTRTFTVAVTTPDTVPRQIALYIVDWDTSNTRSEGIAFTDPVSLAALDTRTITNFQHGKYVIYNFSGSVTITFTEVVAAEPDPTLFGVFLDPYNPQAAVRLSSGATMTTVGTGADALSTISLVPANGFSAAVTVAASPAWPSGITGTFAPNPATTASTVTISVDKTVVQGLYLLPVTGTVGSLTTSTLIPLAVNPAPMPMARHVMVAADVATGETVASDVLLRASSFHDADPASVVLVGLQDLGLTTAAPLALLAKDGKSLRVDGEGLWIVDDKGLIAFLPDVGLKHPPTPPGFRFSDVKGNQSNAAMVVIDSAMGQISKLPGHLKQLTEQQFWAGFKKHAIDDPSPALDAGTMLTSLMTLSGALEFIVVPGPFPVTRAAFDTGYTKWDEGGQAWQDLIDICEATVKAALKPSPPPLLERYWRLSLMARMVAQANPQ